MPPPEPAAHPAATGPRWRRWARAGEVPPPCIATHQAVVRERAARLARVLAIATLGWSLLDFAWLGVASALPALPLRVLVTLGLSALATRAPRMGTHAVVHALVWVQAIPFTALQLLVAPLHESALEIGYGLFPYILAAQLALFPLAWWRTLLAASAPALQLGVIWWMHPPAVAYLFSGLWLFVLIVAIAAWTSQAQLRLLVDLLGARHDAFHDALTGLANRRSAGERLEAARAHALRAHQPLSVLMLDLDHFKRVNDRWGHAEGDRVLVALAGILRGELRAGDLAARHGGEEFLAILPGCDAAQALEAAERLRTSVAARRIALSGAHIRVTVSIGAATLQGDEPADRLVARADAAMYRAKGEGRNRCVAAAPTDAVATA